MSHAQEMKTRFGDLIITLAQRAKRSCPEAENSSDSGELKVGHEQDCGVKLITDSISDLVSKNTRHTEQSCAVIECESEGLV